MSEIKLGSQVRDIVTGYEGIAFQKVELLSGTSQIAVQPKCDKDGKYQDGINIDEQTLEVIGAGISDRAVQPVQTHFALGQRVRDTVSGFEGTVVSKTTFLNGCVYFSVVPEMSDLTEKTGRVPEGSFLSHNRLAAVAPAPAETKRSTGGPMTIANRERP